MSAASSSSASSYGNVAETKKEVKDTRRRVKVYVLNDKRSWEDRGTGHVACGFDDRLRSLALVVRSEADNTITLESKILPDTAYQKQQETLIVWSEGENCDLALSFQEKVGCEEIWERICQVQGKDPSVEITQDAGYEGESDGGSPDNQMTPGSSVVATVLQLPPVEMGKLNELNDMLVASFPTPGKREAVANSIESQGYIKKLLELFKVCEDLENYESLQLLYRIFKNIFMLNKNALFEILFSDDNLRDVVGVFEYDPASTVQRHHREYLWDKATFKEVIPIASNELKAKIHQTYRVQYIQDFILPAPSIFEENLLSTLSSFIFFNKVEIVSLIQDDEKFLNELFNQLTNNTTTAERKRDLAMFLKEFCSFSQTLQPQARENFFRSLTQHGILPSIENCLSSTDDQTRLAAIEILSHVVDYNASLVRDFALQQSKARENKPNGSTKGSKDNLLNIIIEQMFYDKDPEISAAIQLAGICKTLIDPENMMAAVPKSDKGEFLSFFYKQCMSTLIIPLNECVSDEKLLKDDYHTSHLISLVLDLLSFCIEHHLFQMRTYAINKNLLKRILVLLKSRQTFLALGALRLFRRIVQLKDEMYNRHIVRERLFDAVGQCFKRNGHKYNLLNSSILELFEFIRTEDISTLVTDVTENYMDYFKDVNYVKTFDSLKLRHEQHLERTRNKSFDELRPLSSPPPLVWSQRQRDPRELDEDEEQWFNEVDPDDWEDDLPSTISSVSKLHADSVLGSTTTGGSPIKNVVTNFPAKKSPVSANPNNSSHMVAGSPTATGTPSVSSKNLPTSSTPWEDELPPVLSTKKDDEEVATLTKPLLQRNQKITVKLSTSPTTTPPLIAVGASSECSPSTIPRPSTSTSPAAVSSISSRRSLVDYDVDDSDEDDESGSNDLNSRTPADHNSNSNNSETSAAALEEIDENSDIQTPPAKKLRIEQQLQQ